MYFIKLGGSTTSKSNQSTTTQTLMLLFVKALLMCSEQLQISTKYQNVRVLYV